jgi:hypothetical protein
MNRRRTVREQIGTVRITRRRVYQLDPYAPGHAYVPVSVVVEPGEYPVYQDGLSRYWRMTGFLNRMVNRLGDGMFAMTRPLRDEPGDDDVVFYSRRYGPDEWDALLAGFARDLDPALTFALAVGPKDRP